MILNLGFQIQFKTHIFVFLFSSKNIYIYGAFYRIGPKSELEMSWEKK